MSKQLLLIGIGIVVGLVSATLIQRYRPSHANLPSGASERSVPDEYAGILEEKNREIVELTTEIEALRAKSSILGAPRVPDLDTNTPAQRLSQKDGPAEVIRERINRREFDQLVAAGFGPDRIEYLQRRAQELQVKQRQQFDEARQKGLAPDTDGVLATMYDKDIGLREEIGEEEYERYRRALGRPSGAVVAEVLEGSAEHRIGMRAGDQVIRYGDRRIFNVGELYSVSSKADLGRPVLIEVLRDGEVLRMEVPGGRMGFRPAPPF